MIKEVAIFIATEAGLTIGTDLFEGHRPQGTIDACDVIIESAGGSVFPELPERADVIFQVLSRAKTYFTARARAWAIYDAIYRDWTLGSAGWTLPIIFSDSISPCDVTTDWTATIPGVLSIDNVDFKEGIGSLKNTYGAPAIDVNYNTVYNPAGSWDWSAEKHILFWLKSDRASTAFTKIVLYIYDTLGNFRAWFFTFSAGEWTAIKKLLSIGDAESGTPPDLALINRVVIQFNTADNTAFWKKIDDLRIVEKSYEAMIIEPLAPPQYIGQDEKRRYEFSVNYLMKIKKL